MKKNIKLFILIFIALFLFNSKSVLAFNNCTQVGNTSFCDDGTYYNQVGNTIYGSDGTSYSQIGNTTSQNTCPYNSTLDYVSQKCKCNNGYVVSGGNCVYKSSNYPTPVYPSIPAPVAPQINLPVTNNPTTPNPLDAICQKTFGSNSIYTGNTDKGNGGNTGGCGCRTGYYWVLGMTTCGNENTPPAPIPDIPTKTNDQICMENYGVNSEWGYKFNDNMGPICDCKAGYEWNDGGTQCFAVSKVTKPTATKDVVEVKNIQDEVKEPARKSFWSRFWGWLGF